MIKKPERIINEVGMHSDGYNLAWDEMEAYYKQEMKNYIRKDSLPSVNEIFNIIKEKHIYIDSQCDTDKFVVVPIKELAKQIIKAIKGE